MASCLLVGAAPSAHVGLDWILENRTMDMVVAVDGGYETLVQRGITPDAAFGDFDSLGYVPVCEHVETFDERKDFTDMDLALNYALAQGFDDVFICNAFVGRLDHTLGNLQLLVQAARHGHRIWGISEEEAVVALSAPGRFDFIAFDSALEGTCSVISHSDQATGVSEEGLAYGIQDALVINRAVWGVSNEFATRPSRIALDEGSLWVFFPLAGLDHVSYGRD